MEYIILAICGIVYVSLEIHVLNEKLEEAKKEQMYKDLN